MGIQVWTGDNYEQMTAEETEEYLRKIAQGETEAPITLCWNGKGQMDEY